MRADDEHDYTEFVSARLARWHKTAYLLCGDGMRADDIVQATVTALYRYWRHAAGVDNLDAYVHRMLVRNFLNERRLKWSRVLLLSETPDRPASAEANFADQDLVRTALTKLPRGQRAVLVLRFLCDLSVDETAAALNCSAGNVKAQTSRGLESMRTRLAVEPATNGLAGHRRVRSATPSSDHGTIRRA